MTIAVFANEALKNEWLSKPNGEAHVTWVNTLEELVAARADAYFDLGFEYDQERLKKLSVVDGPVFINSVIHPLIETGEGRLTEEGQFVRINAWPGFLKREITEVAIADPFLESSVRTIFHSLGWKSQIVPDVPGMISARIIAMIINEAYYTLQAGVSTRDEIDTAMTLGTNYPFGPFEWARKIGLKNIHGLLSYLSQSDIRYLPCENLTTDANT